MENFMEQAMRTEDSSKENLDAISDRVNVRLLHAAMGMQTESAEFTDALKKSWFYGRELDVTNLKEELGDLLWYVAIACDELDSTITEEEKRVISKLQARFPDKFTQERANVRDLKTERAILENN